MTQDEIIRMAREAGLNEYSIMGSNLKIMSRFATLVAEREREACAKAYEKEAESWLAWPQSGSAKRKGAAAIRARNNKDNQP